MPKLEPYSRKLPYSYALGLYPSLSLIDRRPELAQRLLLAPEGLSNDGVEKLRARCRELDIREEIAEYLVTVKENNVYAEAYAQWEPTFTVVKMQEAIDAATQQANARLTETEGMDETAPVEPTQAPGN